MDGRLSVVLGRHRVVGNLAPLLDVSQKSKQEKPENYDSALTYEKSCPVIFVENGVEFVHKL